MYLTGRFQAHVSSPGKTGRVLRFGASLWRLRRIFPEEGPLGGGISAMARAGEHLDAAGDGRQP